MKYDYVIQNGYVIDPAVGTETVKSVYIRNNRIVEPPVDGTVEDAVVINASGCLVLPGLIDFHTHLGYQLSDFGLNPDLYTLPNGITAAVDAGSGGTANFEGMYQNVFSRAMNDIWKIWIRPVSMKKRWPCCLTGIRTYCWASKCGWAEIPLVSVIWSH